MVLQTICLYYTVNHTLDMAQVKEIRYHTFIFKCKKCGYKKVTKDYSLVRKEMCKQCDNEALKWEIWEKLGA